MDPETLNPAPLEGDAYGSYPLTGFDKLFESTTFLTGWLVEGTIDEAKLTRALTNVMSKWRILAGRLYSVQDYDGVSEWRIRVPLSPILPSDYELFKFTASKGEHPISHYLQVPLPTLTRSLPHSLFIDSKTPRQYTDWELTATPLTCWHVTHLPPDPYLGGKAHTCIGFARSHGIFDGVGAAAVVSAVVAELRGSEWEIPPSPESGFNPNPVEEVLLEHKRVIEESGVKEDQEIKEYRGYSALGPTGMVKQLAWHAREKWWGGADRRIIILEKDLLTYLVNSTRDELKKLAFDGEKVDVSTGDILVAWILKSIYAEHTSSNTIVQCNNLASFRHLLTNPDADEAEEEDEYDFDSYVHNLFVPLPYPALSVHTINKGYTTSSLANMLSSSRKKLSINHVLKSQEILKGSYPFPINTDAHETLLVSNVSASRILEADWTPAIKELQDEDEDDDDDEEEEEEDEDDEDEDEDEDGAERGAGTTLCGYRYQLTPNDVLMTNAVYISGRLPNGSVVLDMTINRERSELLIEAVRTLASEGMRAGRASEEAQAA